MVCITSVCLAAALQFAVVSAVGIIYECAVFCYFGSMADNISSIISGEATSGVVEWVLLGLRCERTLAGPLRLLSRRSEARRPASATHHRRRPRPSIVRAASSCASLAQCWSATA